MLKLFMQLDARHPSQGLQNPAFGKHHGVSLQPFGPLLAGVWEY